MLSFEVAISKSEVNLSPRGIRQTDQESQPWETTGQNKDVQALTFV